MKAGISIIICCYNSSERLKKTLKYLAEQITSSKFPWEIIIVDNASTDNTSSLAEEIWFNDINRPHNNFKITKQLIPGLSFAREKGIQESQYEYLLFCDDDNWLSPNYVQTVLEIMEENSQIGALGGLGIPEFEIEPNKWIIQYQGIYATGPQAIHSGEVPSKHVYGAACCYRKSAIQKLFNNGFSYYLTGRLGKKLTAGEDHELCYALALIGYKIWYDERLRFQHFIPKNRISYDYIKKNISTFNDSSFYTDIYKLIIENDSRLNFKTSWLWVLINKIRFLSKDIIFFIKKKKEKNPFSLSIFKASIDSTLFIANNRQKFNATVDTIVNSKWIKVKNRPPFKRS